MERITIEVDDSGQVTVTAESPDEAPEQMSFDSVEEAAGAVRELLLDIQEDAGEEMSPESMWDQEASNRPQNPNLMR